MLKATNLLEKFMGEDKLTYIQKYPKVRWNDNFLRMKKDRECSLVPNDLKYGSHWLE